MIGLDRAWNNSTTHRRCLNWRHNPDIDWRVGAGRNACVFACVCWTSSFGVWEEASGETARVDSRLTAHGSRGWLFGSREEKILRFSTQAGNLEVMEHRGSREVPYPVEVSWKQGPERYKG